MEIIDVDLVKDKMGLMGWCYVVHTMSGEFKPNSIPSKKITYVILKPVFDRKKPKGWKRDLTKKENWIDLFNFSKDPWYNSKRQYMQAMATYRIEDDEEFGLPTSEDKHNKNIFKQLNNKGVPAC